MLFTVDESKCTRCGICIEVCPARIIEMKDADSVPTPVDMAEERCINCGHCVTVCPDGALSLAKMPVEQCPPIQENLFPKPEHLEHFMRARRSIRSFKDKQVKRDEIEKTIEVARFAPTGGNSQLVRWIVVYEREDVLKIGGMVADFFRSQIAQDPTNPNAIGMQNIVDTWDSGFDFICRGAQHLVLTYAPDLMGAGDCIISLTYQELAAFSLGLGPCWGGYVMATGRNNWPAMREFLNIPPEHPVFGAMLLGYPNYKYKRLPLRNQAQISWIG